MKFISAFFLLFTFNLKAQHFDPGLLEVLQLAGSYTKPKIRCGSGDIVTNKREQERAMQECAFALCGNPEKNQSGYVTNANFNLYADEDAKKTLAKLSPKITAVLNKIREQKLKQVNEMQKALLQNGQLKINPEKWDPYFRNQLNDDVFSPYMDIIVNYQKPVAERLRINIKYPPNASADFKAELEAYAKSYETYLKLNSNKAAEWNLYSAAEVKEMAKKRFADVVAVLKEKMKSMPKEKANFVQSNINGFLEGDEQLRYSLYGLSMIEGLEQAASEYNPEFKKYIQSPNCSDELRCLMVYKEHFKNINIISQLNQYKADLENPDVFNRAVNSCKAYVVAKSTNNLDMIRAIDLLARAKEKIQKNVFPKFSSHSRGILQKYFDNRLKVVNRTEFAKNNIESEFNEIAGIFLKSSVINVKPDESESYQILTARATHPFNFNPFEARHSPCSNENVSGVWDSYYPVERVKEAGKDKRMVDFMKEKDLLLFSHFSCQHEKRGEGSATHELGHAINEVFYRMKLSPESSAKYKSFRKCATENYYEFTADKKFGAKPGDAVQTEEDTADLFAYAADSTNRDLFSCALIKPSLSNQGYVNLSIMPVESDSHSAALFRAILEAVNKNMELPYSCQKAIEPFKNQVRIRKCAL